MLYYFFFKYITICEKIKPKSPMTKKWVDCDKIISTVTMVIATKLKLSLGLKLRITKQRREVIDFVFFINVFYAFTVSFDST